MKRLKNLSRPNFLIPAALILANLFACAFFIVGATEARCPAVEPIRDEEVVTLLEYIRSGDRSGEEWEVTLSEQEAQETITWYLHRYPQIPFAHPCVEITSDYVAGSGFVTLPGFTIEVGAKVKVTLQDGLPLVDILDLSIPLPGGIEQLVEQEVQNQLRRADRLPVRFTTAEWSENEVVVQGYVR